MTMTRSDLRQENVSVSVRVEDDDEHDESLARRHGEATHDIRGGNPLAVGDQFASKRSNLNATIKHDY